MSVVFGFLLFVFAAGAGFCAVDRQPLGAIVCGTLAGIAALAFGGTL